MSKVDVLAVMDQCTDMINPRISPEHASWNTQLREARAAIAELIEAERFYREECEIYRGKVDAIMYEVSLADEAGRGFMSTDTVVAIITHNTAMEQEP